MLKKSGALLSKKLVALHGLSMYAPAFFGVLIIGSFLSLQPVPAQSQVDQAKTTDVTVDKPQEKKPVKIAAKPAPAPVTAPAPPPPAPAKPKVQSGTPKSEPVVTPAPDSKVSGLEPTTPAPEPSHSETPPPQTTTGYTSTNWAGYLAVHGYFTSVSGSWIVPSATGNGASTSAESTWIGIGGVTAGDLIQTGTVNIISAGGQASTWAWYEMLPASSVNIPTLTVSQGDSMTASITETGGQWVISITDNTTGQSFTTTVTYASSHSSAEWIEEDPSYASGRQIPFANFHTASFSGSSAIANGVSVNLSTSTAQPVTMVNWSGQPIATPSVITGGTSFNVSQ